MGSVPIFLRPDTQKIETIDNLRYSCLNAEAIRGRGHDIQNYRAVMDFEAERSR